MPLDSSIFGDGSDLDRLALDETLRPLEGLLSTGEDVAVNRPGEAWHMLDGRWRRHEVAALTDEWARGVMTLAASQHRPQHRQAIVSSDIPTGHRLEAITHPATPKGFTALCFRRSDEYVAPVHEITSRFNTSRWNMWRDRKAAQRARSEELLALYRAGDIEGFLAAFARHRRTPLICAATGAGKTYLMKTYLTLLDEFARVMVIEDAREAVLRQLNHVRLLFQKLGITPTELLIACLRLRPDLVVVAELRNPEITAVFVNEAMAGHPGSPTTIHGNNPKAAAKRLVSNMLSAAGANMTADTAIDMLSEVVDAIVPIHNAAGVRSIGEVWFADEAAEHGETFADLIKE